MNAFALTLARVAGAIETVTGNPLPSDIEIRHDTRLVDVGIDSDSILDLIKKLEEDLEVPMGFLADEAETVSDLLDHANLGSEGAAS